MTGTVRAGLWAALAIALACGTAQAQGQVLEVLDNAGFERGLEGWSMWPGDTGSKMVVDEIVRCEGAASLRVDAVNPADRAYPNTIVGGLEPEVLYRVTVCLRATPGVPEDSVGFGINYLGEDGKILRQVEPIELIREPEGEWTRYGGLFHPTPEVAKWQIVLRFRYAVGSAWFDGVRIERLGDPQAIVPDVWSYLPLGVEIGEGPLNRYRQHEESEDEAYRMARRYNGLLFASAYAEDRLRQAERCAVYAGRELPATPRERFEAAEQALNETYRAFGKAFRSGEEADRQAFYAQADGLEAAIEAVDQATAGARAELVPAQAAELPSHLGEQPRSVPPFDGEGRMNRILTASSNYSMWVEFMKPFDLELRDASGTGRARTWTETEKDFSNITELCDHAQEIGYAGTFGVAEFGVHDVMWVPQWFVDAHADDPDFVKTSWDGCRGEPRGRFHKLNFHQPAVREYIREYLTDYAGFCRDEPRIYFYETSQEALGPLFTCDKGRRQTGYGPSALAEFRARLAGRHGNIAALNEAWGTEYAGFDAIEPPPDRWAVPDREITPLVAEFERFREDSYLDYLKLIYDSLRAGDPTKPVAARHSALLDRINGARIFETCDLLGCHNFAPKMQLMNCYLASLAKYNGRDLAYLEDFWGCQEERHRVTDERAQRRGLDKHTCRTFIWGRTLQVKWYAYTSGDYLTRYNGNWFNPRYDILTARYCTPALAVALRWVRNLDWMLTHSEMPRFRLGIWQPSASMRVQARADLSYGEILALHRLLYPRGMMYELVPEEYFADGRADLEDFDVVLLPCAEYLSEEHQRLLIHYVRGGGTLIAIEPPGVRDELTRPSGTMLRELWGVAEASYDTGTGRWVPGVEGMEALANTEVAGLDAGEGEAWLTATTLVPALGGPEGEKALLDLLAERVERLVFAEDAMLEVVMRIAENGERYLFALNPDPDHSATDRIHLRVPVTSAVDVSVEGGYPVAVAREGDEAVIEMTLGPCETAAVLVR